MNDRFKRLLLLFVGLFFIGINIAMYMLVTRRLGNNFSDTSRMKMIDVAAYLPFENREKIARVDTDFKLTEDLPVLDGAAALVPVYASVIENVYPEGCVTYEGGVFSDDNYYGENFAPDSKMQYQNSVRGFQALVDGSIDVFFCAMPSEEQKKYAKEQGVEIEYVPIGLEAFVFFVNQNNPVDDLSVDEIRSIYAGNIQNWKMVGGADRAINPVTRYPGSGSQTMMEAFMKDEKIGNKSLLRVFGASIGFSFRYYLNDMVGNEQIKTLSVNGVYPSEANIRNRSYPIVTNFYAAYRKDNQNENVKALTDWLLSPDGQKLIEKCGYVGYNTYAK